MTTKKRQVLMRFQPESYDKLKVLAAYNKRSVTNQVEILVNQFIRNFEQKNGTIPLVDNLNGNNIKIANINNEGINNKSVVMQ